MSLSPQEMSQRGIAGAFAKIAKYGADHAPRAMNQGRINKALAQIDAWVAERGETLSDPERQRRASYLIASQNRANLIKANQARQANARIKQIAKPPTACAYCAAELNQRMPKDATHQTCRYHARLSPAEIAVLAGRFMQKENHMNQQEIRQSLLRTRDILRQAQSELKPTSKAIMEQQEHEQADAALEAIETALQAIARVLWPGGSKQ